jgi:hypothetical protein
VLDPTRAPPRPPPQPPNATPQVPPSWEALGGLGGAWDREFDPTPPPPPPKPALPHLWVGPAKFLPSIVFTAHPAQKYKKIIGAA